MRDTASSADHVPLPSRRVLALFRVYLRFYLRRHFHAMRVAHSARLPDDRHLSGGPLIIYLNHPSWWDPLVCMMLAHCLRPPATHYAPMDAAALGHYGLLRRMGLFPVEAGTRRGAVQFLRSANQVLALPGSVLWITPQGRFADARVRPIIFKPGLAALLKQTPHATVLPVALEYTFWNERLPEILINIGEPIQATDIVTNTTAQLTEGLLRAQEELAQIAATRDPARFDTLLSGNAGVSGIYELWQRLHSQVRGNDYTHEHGNIWRR